jgi:hypothetical protein
MVECRAGSRTGGGNIRKLTDSGGSAGRSVPGVLTRRADYLIQWLCGNPAGLEGKGTSAANTREGRARVNTWGLASRLLYAGPVGKRRSLRMAESN